MMQRIIIRKMDDDRVLTTMYNKSNEFENDDSTKGICLGKKQPINQILEQISQKKIEKNLIFPSQYFPLKSIFLKKNFFDQSDPFQFPPQKYMEPT